ncbi:MAG TPA: hypothetical protein DIW80_10695 [Gordonia polyisoprenivorans]|uniref:hypothetical protein n=1 Tax=Gordonia polyisoprenivorans TaxID=84595 RepID=UPI00037CD5A0|nr:hypothetical protein [Gordonia polyisoprenivorans]UZF55040.1 hypothetical protein LH935_20265 [Gordonia polyisoprenivorans]HCS57619.1 hypothetical protein [Gordonia polyisoprenivorans]
MNDAGTGAAANDARRHPQWYGVLTARRGGPLPPARAASRLSAYVYGNLLVLAAIVLASAGDIYEGHAVLIVLGTGLTTYIAHIFADLLAWANIPEAHESTSGNRAADGVDEGAEVNDGEVERPDLRREILDELRDAVPIMSSAIWPAIILALGYHDLIPTQVAQLVSGCVIVIRIASVPIVTERVRGNRLDMRMLIAGLIAAGLAAVIVMLKSFLGH